MIHDYSNSVCSRILLCLGSTAENVLTFPDLAGAIAIYVIGVAKNQGGILS
jgi:hypothetical protein